MEIAIDLVSDLGHAYADAVESIVLIGIPDMHLPSSTVVRRIHKPSVDEK